MTGKRIVSIGLLVLLGGMAGTASAQTTAGEMGWRNGTMIPAIT